ncbi:IGS10 protein, partial [Crypturellus soui]|nr:IGS10 protein [Crypturellus soui]
EDGRIIVLETGTFTLRTADSFDTGLYHCIGTNYADADILTFRITVVDPYEEHTQVNGAQLSTLTGSALSLPCPSTAVPDASISWVLPGHVILHHSVRNKHIFENGTLKIQSVTKQDSGYFTCVAANQYGVDLLVFQVHVKMDGTRLQEKHAAGGEGEAEEGSGNVMLAPVTRHKNSLASLATLTAPQESATSAPGEQTLRSASRRKSFGKMTYRRHRDRASSRFRGHRRQFASSARRADPQRWAALLEKTKRNSTLTEEQTVVATSLPIQALKSSNVSEDEEETSGEPTPPELESMILAAKIPSLSPLGKAMENMATADLPGAAGSAPTRNTSAGVADAVTPPAPPFSHSVSPDTRRPQTYLKPTVTSPESQERSDLSQIPANGMDQSTVSYGAGRTSMVFNAAHRLVSSEENNSQYLKFVSVTPMASAAATTKHVTPTKPAEKLLVFAKSIDKTLTSTDPQVSAVTGSEPVTESGYIYFHSTQKPLTPKLLGSANITQQQVQLFGDVTTHAPQARRQHGRRRKISVRRRIVRPDRIPALSEHRYNLGSPGSTRGKAAAGAQPTTNHISNSLSVNNIDSSPNPHSPEAPLSPSFTTNGQLERSAGAHGNTALLLEEKNELTARQAAASAVVPFTAEDTWADSQWKSEASSQANTASTQPIALEAPPTLHTPHVAAETTHTASNEVLPTFDPISPNGKWRMSPKNYQIEKTTWEGASGNATDKAVSKKLPQTHREVLPSPAASAAHPAPTAALPTADASPLAVVPVSHEDPHAAALLSPDQDAPGTSGEHSPATGLPPRASPAASVLRAVSLEPSAAPAAARPAGGMPRAGRRRGQRRRRPQQGPAAPRVAAGARSAALAPASAMPTSTGPCSAQAEGASPASRPPPATAAA